MVWVTALYTSHQQTHGGEMTGRRHRDGVLSLEDNLYAGKPKSLRVDSIVDDR